MKETCTSRYIGLPYAVYDSETCAELRPIHIAVLVLLIRKHNGHNNGKIPLGLAETAARCHCNKSTALRALKRLQEIGLVSLIHKGHLVAKVGVPNVVTSWKLNFIPARSQPNKPKENAK